VPNSTSKLFKIRQSANSLKLRSEPVSQYMMRMTSITGKPYVTQFKKWQNFVLGLKTNSKQDWTSDSTRDLIDKKSARPD